MDPSKRQRVDSASLPSVVPMRPPTVERKGGRIPSALQLEVGRYLDLNSLRHAPLTFRKALPILERSFKEGKQLKNAYATGTLRALLPTLARNVDALRYLSEVIDDAIINDRRTYLTREDAPDGRYISTGTLDLFNLINNGKWQVYLSDAAKLRLIGHIIESVVRDDEPYAHEALNVIASDSTWLPRMDKLDQVFDVVTNSLQNVEWETDGELLINFWIKVINLVANDGSLARFESSTDATSSSEGKATMIRPWESKLFAYLYNAICDEMLDLNSDAFQRLLNEVPFTEAAQPTVANLRSELKLVHELSIIDSESEGDWKLVHKLIDDGYGRCINIPFSTDVTAELRDDEFLDHLDELLSKVIRLGKTIVGNPQDTLSNLVGSGRMKAISALLDSSLDDTRVASRVSALNNTTLRMAIDERCRQEEYRNDDLCVKWLATR